MPGHIRKFVWSKERSWNWGFLPSQKSRKRRKPTCGGSEEVGVKSAAAPGDLQVLFLLMGIAGMAMRNLQAFIEMVPTGTAGPAQLRSCLLD